jgi:hypothetical protein
MTNDVKAALNAKTSLEAMLPYRPLLESALAYAGGTHTFEDVVEAVTEGRMHFWPAKQSALVTELIVYPRAKGLHVFLAAGDLDEIKGFDESLQNLARLLDAKYISLSGRRGWQKTLSDIGFRLSHITMVKEVIDVDG